MRDIIKKELKNQGLTASGFAEKIGLRVSSLTEYLAGRKELNSANIEKVYKGLGLTLFSAEDMANQFTRGQVSPIYERMILDIPLKGITENKLISKVQLVSYICGMLAAKIAEKIKRKDDNSWGVLSEIVFQENDKKPMRLRETLINKFTKHLECFNATDRELYANICSELSELGTNEGDDVAFMSAFFKYVSIPYNVE